MRNLFDDFSVADVKNRLEDSYRRNQRQYLLFGIVLSVIIAAAVTLLVIRYVRAKRFNDWFDDEFYDDFDDDFDDEDFDIEIENGDKTKAKA